MTDMQPTRQLLDPAGTMAVYPTTIWLTALAFISGVIPTIGSLISGGGVPALLLIAIAIFAGCCAFVVVAANPYRAPFSARSHFMVHLLAVLAFVVSSSATWGQGPTFARGSWVAMGLGVLIIAVAPYRPVRELAAAGTITAAFVALATFVKADAAGTLAPPLAVAAGSAVAILALCYGNAAYSGATIRALERSRRQSAVASDALSTEVSAGLARLVREDRATILERDVRPFFAELIATPHLTSVQRERARTISDSIRSAMVADADRTWLGALFARSTSTLLGTATIDDPFTVAPAMGLTQRTTLRAFLVAAGADTRATGLSVAITADGRTCDGSIGLRLDCSEHDMRTTYGPYLAVMRVAFSSSSVHFDQPSLTVRFRYERA